MKIRIPHFRIRLREALSFFSLVFLPSLPSSAQSANVARSVLVEANTQIKSLTMYVVAFLKTIMGLGAIVMLVMVVFKIYKGDQQAAEKLAWWVAGLALGFVLLQVVQTAVLA